MLFLCFFFFSFWCGYDCGYCFLLFSYPRTTRGTLAVVVSVMIAGDKRVREEVMVEGGRMKKRTSGVLFMLPSSVLTLHRC